MSQIASRDFQLENNSTQSVPARTIPSPDPTTEAGRAKLASMYAPAAAQLAEVETILQAELKSDTPFVDQLLQHSWLLGGKRMRPVLLLLSGMAAEAGLEEAERNVVANHDQALVLMATAVEMIHTATLVHDDVLDKADMRRHQPTANAQWGDRVSVLLGDYLFTHAFHVASKSGSAEALGMLASSSNMVCAGEMKQNFHAGNFEIEEATYFEIITQKTAELCASSCGIGALIAASDSKMVAGFEQYGRDLGIAFQIIDDVLDLTGTQHNVGKTLGTDLFNAKPTLPVIHCLKTLEEPQKKAFLKVLSEGTDVDAAIEWMMKTDSISYARQIAQQHATAARCFASGLVQCDASKSLANIAQFILERAH